MLTYFDRYAAAYEHYKGGAWCYEDGCLYRGLTLLHAATDEARWFSHLKRLADMQVSPEGTLTGYAIEEFNIDHILSGRALLYLHKLTKDERYRRAARLLARQLEGHPRTESGVYWHKKIYPWQVWLDGLYMGLPFQIELAQAIGDAALMDDALRQLDTALRLTFEAETGLYAHGYDESLNQKWADPETGRSPAHWARALGWLAMALVDIVGLIGAERARESGVDRKAENLLARIAACRGTDGLWLQVIDRPDLPGNYAETSATAMFAYAFVKAERVGLFEGGISFGTDSLEALAENALQRAPDGTMRLAGICHMAGLGGHAGVYRDGTAEYYLREPVVADDPKGVGPLMMAKAEALRATAMNAGAPAKAEAASRA